jgi:hypothetical protein
MTSTQGPIEIVPVTGAAEMDRFITLPNRLHADDPHYVPQLVLERREAFSPKKNPYFTHAEVQFWLARRDGRDVGRISAQIDRLVADPRIGHFGLIAAEDDPAISPPCSPPPKPGCRRAAATRSSVPSICRSTRKPAC